MANVMDLNQEKKENVLIINLKGRLDAITSTTTENKIMDVINQGEHLILLNFSDVDYLSSAGLRTLLTLNKTIRSNNGKLILTSLSTHVADILKMSGFDHVLTIASNLQEGLALFKSL